MLALIKTYTQWLHGRWPAGTVERLPVVGSDGKTDIPGVRVVGDLAGIPLLKFSSDSGAKAVHAILREPDFASSKERGEEVVDVAILGAGVSGVSAAIECAKAGLTYSLIESAEAFSTIANFPKQKPIYTYPTDMVPAGGIQYSDADDVKERLLESLQKQTSEHRIVITPGKIDRLSRERGLIILHHADGGISRARRVIVAIGRSGNFRTLNVPGESLGKVVNRLHDPKDYANKDVLVVGGGDSAVESALALAGAGARVTLAYRGKELSRPKPANLERLAEAQKSGSVTVALDTQPVEIREGSVILKSGGDAENREVPNDTVFTLIGREAPLEFFRKSGLPIQGERTTKFWLSLAAVLAVFTFLYQWKKPGTWLPIAETFKANGWFPFELPAWWAGLGAAFTNPATLPGTLSYVIGDPGFFYSILYTGLIIGFGIARIRRRRTPYVTRQTLTLMAVQLVPLFLLPYLLLPWAGFNGWFDAGVGRAIADQLFPVVGYGSGREYWRAFGLILAWPLFLWNVFTHQPLWTWLAISLFQTFVIIPLIVYRWGKGAYCGWICSCGAMAETLGDTLRQKMPHGPFWNRFNMVGQVFLGFSLILLVLRVLGWLLPGSVFEALFTFGLYGGGSGRVMPWSYAWFVDLLWAGIIGFGLYFHFSGRVWCRFACPLAALMHIYARFSRFRIFAEKSKCISCNVCTSVCHQGIDVMNFANKGLPMEDPECVRCSACVQQCPTGVLAFGRLGADGQVPLLDTVAASPVRMREQAANPTGKQ